MELCICTIHLNCWKLCSCNILLAPCIFDSRSIPSTCYNSLKLARWKKCKNSSIVTCRYERILVVVYEVCHSLSSCNTLICIKVNKIHLLCCCIKLNIAACCIEEACGIPSVTNCHKSLNFLLSCLIKESFKRLNIISCKLRTIIIEEVSVIRCHRISVYLVLICAVLNCVFHIFRRNLTLENCRNFCENTSIDTCEKLVCWELEYISTLRRVFCKWVNALIFAFFNNLNFVCYAIDSISCLKFLNHTLDEVLTIARSPYLKRNLAVFSFCLKSLCDFCNCRNRSLTCWRCCRSCRSCAFCTACWRTTCCTTCTAIIAVTVTTCECTYTH